MKDEMVLEVKNGAVQTEAVLKHEHDLEKLFFDFNYNPEEPRRNAELDNDINNALMSFNEFNDNSTHEHAHSGLEPLKSPLSRSPFDSPENLTSDSLTSQEEETKSNNHKVTINPSTVATIKQSMTNVSKLTSLFTTLKVTYLKLCKEFNYLLTKFNENEKIKIELIQENNTLRALLTLIIRDREIDRQEYETKLRDQKCKYETSIKPEVIKPEVVEPMIVEELPAPRRKRRRA